MPELRLNPLTGEWVVIATERAARPESFSQKDVVKAPPMNACPFCMGREDQTPPEVYAVGPEGRLPNTPDWKVRVVPNKFSAFARDIIPADEGFLQVNPNGVVAAGYAYGAHEVIVSSPAHELSIGQLELEQVERIVQTYQRRYRVLAKDKLVKYVQIICNHGKVAGASLEHPHSQIFGMPVLPQNILTEIERTREYYKLNKRHMLLDAVQNAREKNLVIYENDAFVMFEPFWAKVPFETWIVPKHWESRFDQLTEVELNALAQSISIMLQKLYLKLNNPPYNYYIHTLPVTEEAGKDKVGFLWHLECIPRISIQAGLEYGTGVFINTMMPEKAAEFLRES